MRHARHDPSISWIFGRLKSASRIMKKFTNNRRQFRKKQHSSTESFRDIANQTKVRARTRKGLMFVYSHESILIHEAVAVARWYEEKKTGKSFSRVGPN